MSTLAYVESLRVEVETAVSNAKAAPARNEELERLAEMAIERWLAAVKAQYRMQQAEALS